MNVLRECAICRSIAIAFCPTCRADVCDMSCFEAHQQETHKRLSTPSVSTRITRRGYELASS